MSELRLPDEVVTAEHFLEDHLTDHISRVNVNSADGHHLLSLSLGETPQQQGDQFVKSGDLLFVIILQSVLVSAGKHLKHSLHLHRPEYLGSSKRYLVANAYINLVAKGFVSYSKISPNQKCS